MKNNNPDFSDFGATSKYIGRLMNLPDISKMLSHDVELTIRGINRRLESYGKIIYTPAYAKKGGVHLSQYNEIMTELRSILIRVRGNENILGKKGDYVLISRSKETIEKLKPHLQELKDLYNKIPSFQKTKERIQRENGRKMKRSEILDYMKRESDVETLSDYITILGLSDQIEFDSELNELIKPFRGIEKGGTRKKGEPVPQEAVDALIDYIVTHRTDILFKTGLYRNMKEVEIDYSRGYGADFSNNLAIRGDKGD